MSILFPSSDEQVMMPSLTYSNWICGAKNSKMYDQLYSVMWTGVETKEVGRDSVNLNFIYCDSKFIKQKHYSERRKDTEMIA